MSRHNSRHPVTAGLPHNALPRAAPAKRVPGTVDIIRSVIATNARTLDALVAPDAHKILMADLSPYDKRKAEKLRREYAAHGRQMARILTILTQMNIVREKRYKKRARLTATSTYSHRLRHAFTTERDARVAALRALYQAALTDTLGLKPSEVVVYMTSWRSRVDAI